VRKGTGKLAMVLGRDGAAAVGVVCARCQARGVLLVSAAPATMAPACTACKRGAASVCGDCAARVATHAQELATANVVLKQLAGAK
jgi:hypothetical protein